jgi:hypothetical protein
MKPKAYSYLRMSTDLQLKGIAADASWKRPKNTPKNSTSTSPAMPSSKTSESQPSREPMPARAPWVSFWVL